MRGEVLWVLISAYAFAAAVPRPTRYDQRQSGTYNLHLSLKDGQVLSVVKDVLVSAPVRNFGVTLKGPVPTQATRTESPRVGSQVVKNASPSISADIPPAATITVPQNAVLAKGNITSSRRQNNKVASQIMSKQTTRSPSTPPPPPPPPVPVDTQKSEPSEFPPVPPSIIAILTENRPVGYRSNWLPAQLNEITWKN